MRRSTAKAAAGASTAVAAPADAPAREAVVGPADTAEWARLAGMGWAMAARISSGDAAAPPPAARAAAAAPSLKMGFLTDKKEKKAPHKDKAKGATMRIAVIPCVMAVLVAALYQAYPAECDEAAASLGRAILSLVLPPPEAGEGFVILISFLISRVMFISAAGLTAFVLYLFIWVLILGWRLR